MVIKLVDKTTKLFLFDSEKYHIEIFSGRYRVTEDRLCIPPKLKITFMEGYDENEFHYWLGDVELDSPLDVEMELTHTEMGEWGQGHLLVVKNKFGSHMRVFIVNLQIKIYIMNDDGQTIETIR